MSKICPLLSSGTNMMYCHKGGIVSNSPKYEDDESHWECMFGENGDNRCMFIGMNYILGDVQDDTENISRSR